MAGNSYTGNLRSAPEWKGDFGGREHIMPVPARIDPAQFTDKLGITVTVDVAGAAGNATSVPVLALALPASAAQSLITAGNVAIPSGTVLNFGGKKFATTTADALYGATALTVSAIPTALVSGDVAIFNPLNTMYIPSGTEIGRTFAERDAGTAFGPAATTDDEIFLTAFDVDDARRNADVEIYRHGSLVKENYLPNYTALNTAANEVQNVVIGGTATAGTFQIGVQQASGAFVWTDTIAWNATNATIISNINTALNDVLGSSKVAATDNSGTAANPNFNLTFSGTSYLGIAQPLVQVDVSALTGASTVTVSRTTAGGKGVLTILRSKYRCITGKD